VFAVLPVSLFVLLPSPQATQLACPATPDHLPALQFTHSAAEDELGDGLLFPTPQLVHSSAPGTELYLPAAQPLQGLSMSAGSKYSPAGQELQPSEEVRATWLEYFPTGQSTHTWNSALSEYFPAVQSEQ
jgi:hypothetical protein